MNEVVQITDFNSGFPANWTMKYMDMVDVESDHKYVAIPSSLGTQSLKQNATLCKKFETYVSVSNYCTS
jgi:hypothetical protein